MSLNCATKVLAFGFSAQIETTGYVSNNGLDGQDCGFNSSTPCRTLQYMTSKLSNLSYIYVLPEGPDEQQSIYDPGGDVLELEMYDDVTIHGKAGTIPNLIIFTLDFRVEHVNCTKWCIWKVSIHSL